MAELPFDVRQAGAIVFRKTGEATTVLLVRAKKNPWHWIFPKGHIEPGESEEAASIRELREEAGVEGYPIRRAGDRGFDLNGKHYNVVYFLLRYHATVGAGEPGRDPRWCTIDDAHSLLTFPDIRELLRASATFFDAA